MKRFFAFFMALILCFQVVSLCAFAAEDSGSPKHIPRVVSIVFDDSGSMYKDTDRWAYTSYAMQSFAAMMGSEDVLYITYLNGPAGTVKVDLSDGAKHKTVSDFSDIVFGGGTPNKVQKGAECLTREYANYKTNAKYYLVVMADGELDSGLGKLSEKVESAASSTKTALAGADFQAIYFSMKSGDKANIAGATSHFAATSDEIVSTLKNVSADIMGRTAVAHTVAGDKLSFTLQYPALSIAVFAQKKNGDFASFQAAVQKDGKALPCQVGDYSVKCPTKITKNTKTTVYKEKIPANPPAGVVSLITNGGNALAKGTYTIDLSGYGLQKDDVVVLVEPAVRIGCKYTLNNDDATISFEELKKRVSEGDTVTVECGLYELNSDGSLGDAVPLDVLSPEYKILVNGKQVGSSVSGMENAYSFQVDKSFENQEMKVEALLKGYQPFVLKETFGELSVRIKPVPDPEGKSEISLTKPLWKKWSAGEEGIRFELEKADASVLEKTAIAVEGCESLPAGICSALGNAVRVDGSTIVYLPVAQLPFAQLPESFTVSLTDLNTSAVVTKKTVRVIRPVYQFEIENQLGETALNLEQLKQNSAAVIFTLKVDYDGSGQYIPVNQSDCEDAVKLAFDSGVLPGNVTEAVGQLSFVAQYDQTVNTQVPVSEILGKTHSLIASAEVDGQEVKSDTVTVSVSSAAYRLEVENEITQPLSLDTVKTNQQKVIFRLLADYDGNGNFGQLADWDTAALDKLEITSGELPGKIEMAYDAGGKPVGKAFIPQYDENNSNGVPFTAVAGKTHEIICSVKETDLSASTSVEILAPDYEIIVRKDGIRVTDVQLRGNTLGVEFTVLRDDRPLTRQELEGLAPYALAFDKEQTWMKITAVAMEAEDGTAYLLCMPQYGGWSFPATWFWNWLCLFTVKKGDMHMTLTLGEDVGVAALSVATSKIAWIIFVIALAVLMLILWIVFCCATRIRFLRGVFYKVTFRRNSNGLGYVVSNRTPQNANKNGLLRYLLSAKFLIPFCEQSVSVVVERKTAVFLAQKSPVKTFSCRSFPYSVGKKNQQYFNKGRLSKSSIRAIINRDQDFVLDEELLTGVPCSDGNKKLDSGAYLVEKGSNKIIFFITKSDEKALKEKRSGRARSRKNMQKRK